MVFQGSTSLSILTNFSIKLFFLQSLSPTVMTDSAKLLMYKMKTALHCPETYNFMLCIMSIQRIEITCIFKVADGVGNEHGISC